MCKFKDANDNKFIKATRRLQAEVSSLEEQILSLNDVRVQDLLKYVTPTHEPSSNSESHKSHNQEE
jgi:hypothetical protein